MFIAGCQIEEGVTYLHGDIGQVLPETFSHQACCSLCTVTPTCKFFTYNVDTKDCWLKNEQAERNAGGNMMISGTTSLEGIVGYSESMFF